MVMKIKVTKIASVMFDVNILYKLIITNILIKKMKQGILRSNSQDYVTYC